MKKVYGYIDIKTLGQYDFEFFVDDDTSEEGIKAKLEDVFATSIHYDVEEGYEERKNICYKKREEYNLNREKVNKIFKKL